MPTNPALRVVPVDASLREALLTLGVLPEQQRFVGRIDDLLADAESRTSCEPMTILLDATPIGFYTLELNPRTIAGRDFRQGSLGLRGFFIDHRWQQRRLGQAAMQAVLADIASRHPGIRQLALTVNLGNPAALALYRNAGFEDSTERYHGGPAGPQMLLLRALDTP